MNRIKEYDILKVYATILVIIGHCTYYTISTNYGGIYYSAIMASNGIVDTQIHKILEFAVSYIYTFHMPLFMAISGAIFSFQFNNGTHNNYKKLIISKSKRLLIPFLVVNVFYSIPLKFISIYWHESKSVFIDIFVGQILLQGNSHLWYLEALFVIILITVIVEKYIPNNYFYKLALFLIINSICSGIPLLIFRNPLKYLIWFYIGYLSEPIRNKLNVDITKFRFEFILLFLIHISIFVLNRLHQVIIISQAAYYLLAFIGIYISYSIAYKISKTKISKNKWVKGILDYSFGLYLYSDPLNYLILYLFYKFFKISFFGNEIGSLVIFISRLSLTFIGALSIAKILKSYKFKYIY